MSCGPLLSSDGSASALRRFLDLPKGAPFRGRGGIGARVLCASSGSRFFYCSFGQRSPGDHLNPPTAGRCAGRRCSTKIVNKLCRAQKKYEDSRLQSTAEEEGQLRRRLLQAILWTTEATYIIWLFLLPYAPGDPVWAISQATINEIIGLSLNFFFVLPILNSVGIHVMEGPVLHPMSEALFNFVIGWTLMFAPLLFNDRRRDRYGGSLDILWGFQLFLTNTFLIPYMAIRLNDDKKYSLKKPYQVVSVMSERAPVVGLIGGTVCLFSMLWAVYGRANGGFGDLADRLLFLGRYVGSDRLAYAFIWDIILYTIFQPWLISASLQNARESTRGLVKTLRFVPVVGLVAYLLCLEE